MSLYSVNWPILVKYWVAGRLRQARQLAWLRVLVGPVARLHGELAGELVEAHALPELSSTTMVVERWLNKTLLPTTGVITVRNLNQQDRDVVIYAQAELKEATYLYAEGDLQNPYLYAEGEDTGYDMEVLVPAGAGVSAVQVQAELEKMLTYVRRYLITVGSDTIEVNGK